MKTYREKKQLTEWCKKAVMAVTFADAAIKNEQLKVLKEKKY